MAGNTTRRLVFLNGGAAIAGLLMPTVALAGQRINPKQEGTNYLKARAKGDNFANGVLRDKNYKGANMLLQTGALSRSVGLAEASALTAAYALHVQNNGIPRMLRPEGRIARWMYTRVNQGYRLQVLRDSLD